MTGDGSKFTQRKKCQEKFCLSLGSAGQLSPVKRAAPYGAALPGLTGSHMFVMFLTLSNKTAHFKPSGRDGKKGSSPEMSLSKYSHRYNEGCGARFMCLIKWTNIVSRLRRKKINRLWDFSCAIGGIVLPAQRISRARRKRYVGSQRS